MSQKMVTNLEEVITSNMNPLIKHSGAGKAKYAGLINDLDSSILAIRARISVMQGSFDCFGYTPAQISCVLAALDVDTTEQKVFNTYKEQHVIDFELTKESKTRYAVPPKGYRDYTFALYPMLKDKHVQSQYVKSYCHGVEELGLIKVYNNMSGRNVKRIIQQRTSIAQLRNQGICLDLEKESDPNNVNYRTIQSIQIGVNDTSFIVSFP